MASTVPRTFFDLHDHDLINKTIEEREAVYYMAQEHINKESCLQAIDAAKNLLPMFKTKFSHAQFFYQSVHQRNLVAFDANAVLADLMYFMQLIGDLETAIENAATVPLTCSMAREFKDRCSAVSGSVAVFEMYYEKFKVPPRKYFPDEHETEEASS